MKPFQLILLLLACCAGPVVSAQSLNYLRVRFPASKEQMKIWQQEPWFPPHFHYRHDTLEMELDPDEYKLFLGKKIRHENRVPAISEPGKKTNSLPGNRENKLLTVPANFTYGSMSGYYTFQEVMDVLDSMRSRFPSLVSVKDTLGFTYEGRPIIAVNLTDHPDSAESYEDEWLMTSLHHANEVMGVHITIYFAWYILEQYETNKEIRDLLNHTVLCLVPVVNPDGLAYNESLSPSGGGTWRKNRRPRVIGATTHYGVDLNRNYGFNWAYTHPGQLGQAGSNFAGNNYYRGLSAWSEPETQALRNLCLERDFTAAFNYHAWDDSFIYPWNFDIDSLTSDSLVFAAIAQYCTEENQFETGTFDATLGYTGNGTSDDWMYGEQSGKNKIYPFTIEVGKSFWPAQPLITTYCDSLLAANLKMMRMAGKYARAVEKGADTITTLSVHSVFDLKRYSIRDTVFTVRIVPLDGFILSAGTEKNYPGLGFLATVTDSISIELSPAVTNGTQIRYLLEVDNGAWSVSDTVSRIFFNQTILAAGCEEEYEPNNKSWQAASIPDGVIIEDAIPQPGDEDWYAFSNEADRKNVRIILSQLPADYDMILYDETGNKLLQAAHPMGIPDTIVFNAPYKGRFRLQVNGYRGSYDPFSCYRLKIELDDQPFLPVAPSTEKEKPGAARVVSVFPVPVKDVLNLVLSQTGNDPLHWSLISMTGQDVLSGSIITSPGTGTYRIHIPGISPGYYILQVKRSGYHGYQAVRVLIE